MYFARKAHLLLLAVLLLFGAPAHAETAATGAPPAPATTPATVALPAAPMPPGRVTFAVIIGNNQSLGRRRPDLHYADDDAARYFEILQTMAPGRVTLLADFDRDTARLFPNAKAQASPPKRRSLLALGQRLANETRAARAAGHEVEVYFVFAGHGDVAEGQGFIELSDGRFSSNELKAWLGAIPFTRAHVILDSCNSFFMLGVRKPGGRHFATSEDASRSLAERLPNVGVFLSTSAEGEAFEWSEIQSGIFSHVVRSGLLGAADANADGVVSYLELAAFVQTATAGVRNPNMRPHVFARGPGASDNTPIARLQSMTGVRRFELSDAGSLRLRLRDGNGLPLFDAHTERGATLRVALPEGWAHGAVVERGQGELPPLKQELPRRLYAVPEPPGTVTLAALEDLSSSSAGRGPDETFRTLFAQPFGPAALASYQHERSSQPPTVYGVSKEDTQRMDLLLQQLARAGRGKRISDSLGSTGCGVLLVGAGIGVLHLDPNLSKSERTEARVLGASLLGLGGVFVLGSVGSWFAPTDGEAAAAEFRRDTQAGGDPTQAFAAADKRLQKLEAKRRAERLGEGAFGSIVMLASTTGLIWSEIAADSDAPRMARRLGWGAGILAGGLMLGDAVFVEQPVDALTKIWREDPSLNQYQPSVTVSREGAMLSVSGPL